MSAERLEPRSLGDAGWGGGMNRTIPPEPTRPRGRFKNRCVSIDDATDEVVREAGDGSRSRGIRELVRHWLRAHSEGEQ